MRCESCGREIEPPAEKCPHCADTSLVRVLSPEERENFQGVTLGEEPATGGDYTYESRGPHHRVYVRQVSLGGGMGIWTKLVLLAVIGLLVFVVLPMFFLFFAAAGIVWFIVSLFRR